MKCRTRSVQPPVSSAGCTIGGLTVSIFAFLTVRERSDQRDREKHDHPGDDEQVGKRDQDEAPVEIRGRRIHVAVLLALKSWAQFSGSATSLSGSKVPPRQGLPALVRRGSRT